MVSEERGEVGGRNNKEKQKLNVEEEEKPLR